MRKSKQLARDAFSETPGRRRIQERLTDDEITADDQRGPHLISENEIAADVAVGLNHLTWMTTAEAADYLRVSVGSVKNMVYRGELVPKKLGRRSRFLKAELDRCMKSPFNMKGANNGTKNY